MSISMSKVTKNCRFSYAENRELEKAIVGIKCRIINDCLHSQAGNRVPITVYKTASGYFLDIFINFDTYLKLQ